MENNKKKYILIFSIILVLISSSLSAWATILAPSNGDEIMFSTNVSGVIVQRNDAVIAVMDSTNISLRFGREREDVVLVFRKEGYYDQRIVLSKSFSAVFWINAITGGLVGSSTDSIFTNNAMEYSPNQYYVPMVKK